METRNIYSRVGKAVVSGDAEYIHGRADSVCRGVFPFHSGKLNYSRVMRKYFSLLMAFSFALVPISSGAQTPTTLTIATVAPKDSPWAALLVQFKEVIEKKSSGKMKVKLMLGGVMGDENDMVKKCDRGMIQGVGVSTGALASKIPELNLVELPYLFRTAEEADQVIDNVLTAPMEKLFRARGLVLGFWNENGYRQFGNQNKPIKKPSDLKGLKMRAQENPIHISMYRTFGAAANPIPTTEVVQALTSKNVDGFDQSVLYMIAAGWHKSVKYVTLSDHIYQPAAIAFNQKWFDGLPSDLRELLVKEGRELQGKGRKAVRAITPELNEILTFEKIQVYTLTPEEKKVFEEASKPVYDEFRKKFGAEGSRLLDLTQAELKKIRK